MTYTVTPGTPKAASAAAFCRELNRALAARDIPRNELWRATGIGRTALDNYRVGASLPKTEAAAAIAGVLDWPKLLEIVQAARTKPCQRCGRPFRNEGGNMGAKRYCSVACRETAEAERHASRRARQAGQTGDGRRRYQEVARLRSGIRIAEERSNEQAAAIAAMCAECEPEGRCRTPECPLRAFSPLPLAQHAARDPKTRTEAVAIRAKKRWTPAAREKQSAMTRQLHADGRMMGFQRQDRPANDPARREKWLANLRAGKARAS